MAGTKQTPYKESVGGRIRAIREHLKMGQRELGKLMGASQNQVSQWEAGHTLPSPERMIPLKTLCGATFEYVYGAEYTSLPDKLKVPALYEAAWLPSPRVPRRLGKKSAA